MGKFLIRKPLILQDSYSKKITIDLNILLLDPRLWENVSSFPINDQDEIKIVYLQRGFFQPLVLAIISLKKKLGKYCIDLILKFMYLYLLFIYL